MKAPFYRILKFLTIVTFFVPLVVTPSLFIFPFVVSKVLLFRSLLLLMLGAYIMLYLSAKEQFQFKWTWLHIAVGLYTLSLLISTVLGVQFHNSFWDTHERMLGVFTLLHYVVYYFILSTVFRQKEEWQNLSWWFLGSGGLMVLVAIIQTFRPEFLLNSNSPRVISTLGNAIYVGGYGLFLAYLGSFLGIKETVVWKKALAFFLAAMGVVAIFLSQTRGTLLGLLASLGLIMVLCVFLMKGQKKVQITLSALLLGGTLLLGVLYLNRNTSFVSNIPALGRLLKTSLDTDTASTRIMAWEIAIDSWKEKPLFGWGPANYYYAFNKYYKPEFLMHGWGETWFDNAHNIVMNTLSTQGAFGVLSYFAIFIAAIALLIREYKNKNIDIYTFLVGVGFLTGHFIHNIFVFENPTSYLYFFFFLAFIQSQSEKRPALTTKALKTVSTGKKILVGVIIFLLLWFTDINTARANHLSLLSIRTLYTGNVFGGIELYNKAIALHSPHASEIRSDFIRTSNQMIQSTLEANKVNKTAQDLYDFTYQEGEKNYRFNPLEIRNTYTFVQMLILGENLKKTGTYIQEANTILNDTIPLSPRRQQTYFLLAVVNLSQGKIEDAERLIRQGIDLEPSVAEGWWRLGILYKQIGEKEKLAQTYKEAMSHNVEFSPEQQDAFVTISAVSPSL